MTTQQLFKTYIVFHWEFKYEADIQNLINEGWKIVLMTQENNVLSLVFEKKE